MIPKILCSKCSHEIRPGDKFCPSCGVSIDWDTPAGKAAKESSTPTAGSVVSRCPLCGQQNPAGNSICASCGAALPGAVKTQSPDRNTRSKAPAVTPPPISKFQSWKVTAGAALIIIVAMVIFKVTSTNEPPKIEPNMPTDAHQNQALMNELSALDKAVKSNPNDAATVIQYANRLQDAKFLTKAVEMYKKYLTLRPNDVDATVDLGVTYYEIATTDTMTRVEYLDMAQKQFEDALKLNSKHQLALFNLGIVNLIRGDMANASEWFKKTIEIDSTSETGKRASNLIHQHSFTKKPSQ